MPSPSANPTPITPPRVPLIDQRTGLIDRAWYMYFLSLFNAATTVIDDTGLGPSPESLIASYDAALRNLAQFAETQSSSSEVGELQQQINTLRQEVETVPRPELGSMAPLEQDNVPWLTFNNAPSPVPTSVGTMAWDGGTTMGIQATTNVLMRVGEAEYVYVKASGAINKGDLCYHTGSVGASGVITVAPTPLALADPNQIVGVAAESIALNGFGLIQVSGTLRGFNTTGSAVGETWVDGDALYYNPAYVGSMTKVKPSAPNQKTYIGEVINAAAAGSGSISIRIAPGSTLGGTDSNVQFGTLATNDLIQYNGTYWQNTSSISGVSATFLDTQFTLQDNVDPTKQAQFQLSGITTGTTRTYTLPNLTGTLATIGNLSQTFSGTTTFSNTTTFSAATVTVGSSTATSTYSLGTGATLSGSTKTVNIGTAGTSGSTTAINIGSAVSGATTTATANGTWTFQQPPRATAPVTKTADFSVADTDLWLINNKSGSTCTVTLPTASTNTGRVLYFLNYQAQTLVSASSNVVPLTGGAAGTAILAAVAGDTATLVSDGTNWIMTQYVPNNVLLLE